MSYSDFKFPDVLEQLQLEFHEEVIFSAPSAVKLDPAFVSQLQFGVDTALGVNNEKSRSEFIIAPLLLHLLAKTERGFGLFSGYELQVDASRGLHGVCDYLLSRTPSQVLLKSPLLAIVEVKNDNVKQGYAQCIATMKAAAIFNEKAKANPAAVYGIVTTGLEWRFLRLIENTVTLHPKEFIVTNDLELIAGILLSIVVPSKGIS